MRVDVFGDALSAWRQHCEVAIAWLHAILILARQHRPIGMAYIPIGLYPALLVVLIERYFHSWCLRAQE